MGKRSVIGVDIGGTKTLCLLANEKFEVLHEVKFETAPADGKSKFTANLTRSVRKLARESEKLDLSPVGIGVASAGTVDFENCRIESSPNILFLEGYNPRKVLRRSVKLEVVLGNDVQMALYAEHRLGVAVGCANVLGVFFGTGVGGAAIINKKVYRGSNGNGGHVGATLTHPIGGAETLESHGILDRIASKSSIAGAAIGMGLKQWAPHLYKEAGTDISKVTWGALARARKSGDKQIDELIRARLRVVGIALSSIINFLDPDMLVLGGGLTDEMPRLIVSALEGGLKEYLVPEVARTLKVKAARFGNDAGAIGAALLAWKKFG